MSASEAKPTAAASPTAFLAGDPTGEESARVASLDPPLVQQTKSEIRKLAAEVAELAHSDLSPPEFYASFLAKLTVAMGASAGAIWEVQEDASEPIIGLRAEQGLQAALNEAAADPQEHMQLLACVLREKQPILIPPRTVSLETERPENPLNAALVLVPVLMEGEVDCLLEIVQPSCGGPASQRGYLRFAAQMADLLTDFLRRSLLQDYAFQIEHMEVTESWILDAISQRLESARQQVIAQGLCESFDAQQALLFQPTLWARNKIKPLAFAFVPDIDEKSEIFSTVAELTNQLAAHDYGVHHPGDESSGEEATKHLWWELSVGGNRDENLSDPSVTPERPSSPPTDAATQRVADRLGHLLNCSHLVLLTVDLDLDVFCLLTFDLPKADSTSRIPETRKQRLLEAAKLAFSGTDAQRNWRSLLRNQTTVWVVRSLLVLGLALLACIPVPQKLRVSATLEPVNKYMYYAPFAAVVDELNASEGDIVVDQQPLIGLRSRKLEADLEHLLGEQNRIEVRILELENQLGREPNLALQERDRLEAELRLLRTEKLSLQKQLTVLRTQERELTLHALGAGQVSTWNIEQDLKNRPVQAGDLLLSTYEPDGPWRLQVAIPNKRLGLIMSSMTEELAHTTIDFALASHPSIHLKATLESLGTQVVPGPDPVEDLVFGHAEIDANALPLRKDGAMAHATIDCGRVPLIWLLTRDAVTAVRSWIQLNW